MGRLLYESFIFYASTDCKITTLYHGMSLHLAFTTLFCAFDAPTSCTTAQNVAQGFGHGGIVVTFTSSDSSKYIRTLDMGLFSTYEHEEEHLIFETRLRIKSIWSGTLGGRIPPSIMKWLSLYDLIIHGNEIHDSKLLQIKNQDRLQKKLKLMIEKKTTDITSASYINALISAVVQNTNMWWNMKQLKQLNVNLANLFIGDENMFGEFVLFLKNKYNVQICPVFHTEWILSSETFKLIERATKKYNHLKIAGTAIECKISEREQISFQPELTKKTDLFEIEMKLLKIYSQSNLSIKVHFNLSCRKLNEHPLINEDENESKYVQLNTQECDTNTPILQYHTSLHTRTMDVKHNNTFNITLPKTQNDDDKSKTISLSMSIMLHDISFDYPNCSSLETKVMKENMIQTQKSYKCADYLSIFYGISNSIISTLDSLSDILFVIFLAYYSRNDHAAKIFLILLVGNLIFVSIVISGYICYQIKQKSD
eukprot:288067_1